jgi:drug/metabolite transporter (DMT)-like permease
VYDITKSAICTSLAGLFLIYRTKRTDPDLSLQSLEPWLWLALMTVVVGFVFFVSLFYAP